MKKILIIIAPKDFRDEEYYIPKNNLESAGHRITTASLIAGECTGKLGGRAQSEFTLAEINADNFDAVIFVGGSGAAIYQNNQEAYRIAREFFEKGKLLAAICIAPLILAYAGILDGKKATVWNGDKEQEKIFKELGIDFINEDVVCDGNIVTANGPAAAEKFAQVIIKKFL